MQVVKPIDIEDALRIDLAPLLPGRRVYAPPLPPDLRSGDVAVYRVGGATVSGASSAYDLSVDCYAGSEADACALADEVCGIVASLPLRDTATQYSAAEADVPYANADPRAPQLSRHTFRATVVCPGSRLEF